eukprot:CAMPEP_0176496088 /NCGR_PEP_ID=MMETSP0200_2-20121128/11012_1 /TAXON_ID=947934 /ORGANISM="Chaetoceros sp., Strain GSL56" /LENGTH=281 /DNA_ID=CAMNT_0017894027 /DNA_START=436 /DNA_END=1281 /DNA_ORIENTATION=+
MHCSIDGCVRPFRSDMVLAFDPVDGREDHHHHQVGTHFMSIPPRQSNILQVEEEPVNRDFLEDRMGEYYVITKKPSEQQDHASSDGCQTKNIKVVGSDLSAAADGIPSLAVPNRKMLQLIKQVNLISNYKPNYVKNGRTMTTPSREKEYRTDETSPTSVSSSLLMDLFHEQKDTCPDRVKQLHYLGTQTLLLRKTQAYIKDLQESRRIIKFEIELQKKREEKKLKYRQSLQREDCCERLYLHSCVKQMEAKQRIEQMRQSKNDRNRKSFNLYAAYGNKYVF